MRAPHSIALALALNCGAAPAMELAGVGGARFEVPVTSLQAARFARTLRQQYDFSCGSAALATLLSYHYAYPVTERYAFEQMYASGDQAQIRKEGFSLLDIKRFLEARGFRADGFQLPLQKLAEAGLPAIVLVSENGYQHFVVVKGLNPERVLIGDPAGGTRAVARASFDAMWAGKLLFVIYDRPGPVRFNDPADWRVAPRAPLAGAIPRGGLDNIVMPKHGPGGF
ncbi:MAG: C39 family peptidase [Burkholderiaceae bacterium]|nr:C39 family peptidase [Burkholderiaceae bacterium]